MPSRRAFAASLATSLAVAGCVAQAPTHPPVPAARAEQVPAPPPSPVTLIWQPGHFDWSGSAYAWTPGRWVDRAGHGTLWQDGYWRNAPRGSEWVPGHWV